MLYIWRFPLVFPANMATLDHFFPKNILCRIWTGFFFVAKEKKKKNLLFYMCHIWVIRSCKHKFKMKDLSWKTRKVVVLCNIATTISVSSSCSNFLLFSFEPNSYDGMNSSFSSLLERCKPHVANSICSCR
jgi:hypothetical protein